MPIFETCAGVVDNNKSLRLTIKWKEKRKLKSGEVYEYLTDNWVVEIIGVVISSQNDEKDAVRINLWHKSSPDGHLDHPANYLQTEIVYDESVWYRDGGVLPLGNAVNILDSGSILHRSNEKDHEDRYSISFSPLTSPWKKEPEMGLTIICEHVAAEEEGEGNEKKAQINRDREVLEKKER